MASENACALQSREKYYFSKQNIISCCWVVRFSAWLRALQKLWMNWPRLLCKPFDTSVRPRILDIFIYFRMRHSFAHLRPVILSADWLICRLQSWTCSRSSLPTVAEFVKLTQSIVIEIQRQWVCRLVQSPTLQSTIFCGCPWRFTWYRYTSVTRMVRRIKGMVTFTLDLMRERWCSG